MTETEYLSLCEKYLKGNCTPEEEILLREYQDQLMLFDQPWASDEMGDQARIRNLIYHKLQRSLHVEEKTKIVKFRWLRVAAAAAILVLMTTIGYLITFNPTDKTSTQLVKHIRPLKKDILPGSNKAVLTLADGTNIILDNAQKGVLTTQGNTAVTKSDDGLIVYNFKNNTSQAKIPNTPNILTIPRGGKYEVILPDGTKVWLNSSSTLTFPAQFSGPERVVQLTGEGYFEVAKNMQMPFKVQLNKNITVKVLGTHFNIMAYNDEEEIKTTLFEGSVKLCNNSGNVVLVPGQQGRTAITGNTTFKVQDANLAEAIAWKSGNFMFVNEDIRSIMKKISRWYDVDIDYVNDISGKTFTGTVSRFQNVSEVLKLIQLTGVVHFKIEGRSIKVMQ